MTRDKTRQVAFATVRQIGVTLTATGGFPDEPFERAKLRLAELGVGAPTATGWSHNVPYSDTNPDQFERVRDIVVDLCLELSAQATFTALAEPQEVTFARNDYNIWESTAPALAEYRGKYVRGRLVREATGAETDGQLVPLSKGAPGWVPRFPGSAFRDEVWPPGEYEGPYRLTVSAVGQ